MDELVSNNRTGKFRTKLTQPYDVSTFFGRSQHKQPNEKSKNPEKLNLENLRHLVGFAEVPTVTFMDCMPVTVRDPGSAWSHIASAIWSVPTC